MKNITLFALPLFLLLAASSCSLEKRVYRNGWYSERNHHSVAEQIPVKQEQLPAMREAQSVTATLPVAANDSVRDTTRSSATASPAPSSSKKFQPFKKFRQLAGGNPNRMTYIQAKMSLAEKGCTPDKYAETLHVLAIVAIPLILVTGIGMLLDIVVLILSIFATNKIIAEGGDCMEENLAIVSSAKRIVVISLLSYLALAILVIGLLFYLIYYTNAII